MFYIYVKFLRALLVPSNNNVKVSARVTDI